MVCGALPVARRSDVNLFSAAERRAHERVGARRMTPRRSDRRSSVNASAPLTPTTRSASKRQNTRRGDFPPSDDVGKFAVPGVECLPRLGEIGMLDVVPGGHGISRVIQRSANDLLARAFSISIVERLRLAPAAPGGRDIRSTLFVGVYGFF